MLGHATHVLASGTPREAQRSTAAHSAGKRDGTRCQSARSAGQSACFGEYLREGVFPETQGLAQALRVELLQAYVDTVLFRDVVERYGVSQVAALRWLIRQCLRNPAGSLSLHRLHLDLKAQGQGRYLGPSVLHVMPASWP